MSVKHIECLNYSPENTITNQVNGYWISLIKKNLRVSLASQSMFHKCSDMSFTTGTHSNVFVHIAWWRHQMDAFSPLLVLCHRWIHPTKARPVTRSFDVFFDLHLNKRLRTQLRCLWYQTPSRSLWCHCNYNTPLNYLRVPILIYFCI